MSSTTTIKVESINNICVLTKIILCATLWGQVLVITIILGYLNQNIKNVVKFRVNFFAFLKTFIDHFLAAMAVPIPTVPNINIMSLHISDASTYTEIVSHFNRVIFFSNYEIYCEHLCLFHKLMVG